MQEIIVHIAMVFIEFLFNLLGRQDLQVPDIKCGAYNLH